MAAKLLGKIHDYYCTVHTKIKVARHFTDDCEMLFLPPDVRFEDDDSVTPLMSAAKLWSDLEPTVSDESLFKDVTILLFVQVIIKYLLTYSTGSEFALPHSMLF